MTVAVSENPKTIRQEDQKSFSLRWSAGSVSIISSALFIGYITYYSTDVAGIDATLIGILILVAKIFDALTGLLVGFIVDRTKTKWGKARPYSLSVIIVWLLMIALFSVPDMSSTWKAVYIFTGYTIITSVFYSLYIGSEPVYFRRATHTTEKRTQILSISGAISAFCMIIFMIVMPILVDYANDTPQGWSMITMCLAFPFIALGLVRSFTIKEVESSENSDTESDYALPLKESVSILFKNKYIFIIGLVQLINSLVNSLNSVNTYYFSEIVGNISMASVVGAIALLSPLVIALFPTLSKKVGAKGIVQLGFACGVVSGFVRYFAGANIPLLVLGNFLFTMSLLPMQALLNIFIIDCMEYSHWQSGKKIEGVIASITNFTNNIGSALASGIIGVVMGVAGYQGALAVQSKSALNSIVFLYAILPAILSFISILALRSYDLETKISEIRQSNSK